MAIYDCTPLKRCGKCNLPLPPTTKYFVGRKDTKCGVTSDCRACIRLRNYKANHRNRQSETFREQERIRARAYHLTHREQVRSYDQEYRKRPEVIARRKVTKAAYRQRPENKARHNEHQRQYRKTEGGGQYHKSYMKQYVAANKHTDHWKQMKRAERDRRRALIQGATGTYTANDIAIQLKSQRGKCWWCSKRVGDEYEVDHLIPLARGGSNAAENIVIACQHCNRSKGAKLPHEWSDRLL